MWSGGEALRLTSVSKIFGQSRTLVSTSDNLANINNNDPQSIKSRSKNPAVPLKQRGINMSRRFVCPACGAKNKVESGLSHAQCPSCEKEVKLIDSSRDEAAPVPALGFPDPPPSGEQELVAQVYEPSRRGLILTIVAAALIAAGFCCWYWG